MYMYNVWLGQISIGILVLLECMTICSRLPSFKPNPVQTPSLMSIGTTVIELCEFNKKNMVKIVCAKSFYLAYSLVLMFVVL